jgi:hypothetical protein
MHKIATMMAIIECVRMADSANRDFVQGSAGIQAGLPRHGR